MRTDRERHSGKDGRRSGIYRLAKTSQAASMAQITTSQPVPLPKPERIEAAAFDARVAFTCDGCLWLVDGRQTDSPPIRLTVAGQVEILGWSANGEWLAYLWT